ncbi:MAG: hypothetical protein WCL23_03990 [Candidatus Moraniibacteriota bacterium]
MELESEGGQKFLPPNPLPFCPPERLDFKIQNSNFRQKMFELRPKNTAKSKYPPLLEGRIFVSLRMEGGFEGYSKKANCFAFLETRALDEEIRLNSESTREEESLSLRSE